MMRLEMQSAFVLHSRPYRDTSLIVELFTFEHGRVSAVARGARSPRSKIKGLLQQFSPLVVSTSGRSELAYLNKVECDGAPFLLTADKLLTGIYLNHLLIQTLAKHDPHQQLFLINRKALKLLCRQEEQAVIMRRFEWSLLEQIGYGIDLDEDINGNKIDKSSFYYFVPQQGLFLTTKMVGQVFSGEWLLAWRDKQYQSKEVLQIAKKILGASLKALSVLGSKT